MAAINDDKEFKFKTGISVKLVYPIPTVHIRLFIDPAEASTDDDKYKLFSTDGKYSKTFTVKDDKTDGDKFIDLIYTGLRSGSNYTLEIDPGAEGKPYKVFDDVPFKDLIELYSIFEKGDQREDIPAEEEEKENSGKEQKDLWMENESWGGDPDEPEDEKDEADESEINEEKSNINWGEFNFKSTGAIP